MIRPIRPIRLLPAILALWIAGCATGVGLPSRPPVAQIERFALTGRIAIRQGEARHHAMIDWRHGPGGDEILLTTPLGQGVAEIVRDAAGARLILADGRRFTAADWSELSSEVFGFRLPLKNSARWLLGDSADGENEGWRMTVVERESPIPHALPSVIELERDDMAVHLRIDAWSDVR